MTDTLRTAAGEIPGFVAGFKPGEMETYMMTVTPGLEAVAADEASHKTGAHVRALMRGKVFFTVPEPFVFESLRCADNLYRYLFTAEAGTTRATLNSFGTMLATGPVRIVMDALLKPAFHEGDMLRVNASISGKHNYNRFEAADAFKEALIKQHGFADGENGRRVIELRLDILNGRLLVFQKLTEASFRFRGESRATGKAALRPTLAHALVWAAGPPGENEAVLDPFCGSGTILCERAAYPFKALIGCDVDKNAAALACENIEHAAAVSCRNNAVSVAACDMRTLVQEAASVDIIITNPPWGMQIETENPAQLYTDFLHRADFWLSRSGRIILLTPLEQVLIQAAAETGFAAEKLYTVSLHGTLCYVYKLRRRTA